MENLTAGEYLSLLRAGFSLKDIKNIESVPSIEVKQDEQQIQPASDTITPKMADAPIQDKEEPQEATEEIDYKALYEESQAQVKKLQVANTQENIAGAQEDPEKIILDLVSSFM